MYRLLPLIGIGHWRTNPILLTFQKTTSLSIVVPESSELLLNENHNSSRNTLLILEPFVSKEAPLDKNNSSSLGQSFCTTTNLGLITSAVATCVPKPVPIVGQYFLIQKKLHMEIFWLFISMVLPILQM